MKKLLVMIFALLFCSQTLAAEMTKIGFVDLQRALNESKFGKKTKTELEDLVRKRRAAIEEMAKKKDALKEELDRQATTLSDEALRQRVDELERQERELERLVADTNEELQKLQREKEIVIIKELDDIISGIGKKEGYIVILPSDVILYSEDDADLTDRVIKEYDEFKKEGK